ncbi:MAG: hypothetical protein K2O54_03675 [Prevotella sp.]|nr:hypothetical protein [Prevotella sp.]
MPRKATKAETIAKKPIEEISKLKGDIGRKTLISYVKTMRSSYKRRVSSFKRSGLVSQAQIAFVRDVPKKVIPLEEMTRNQLLYEFFRYASFFNSETSTASGINKVNREQDIRLFGADKRGRPLQKMTNDERTLFWSVYAEYQNQFPADTNLLYSSESVQQTIAGALFGQNSINHGNLVNFLSNISEILKANKEGADIKYGPNVFSGRGDAFKW